MKAEEIIETTDIIVHETKYCYYRFKQLLN